MTARPSFTTDINQTNIQSVPWISNHIHLKLRDANPRLFLNPLCAKFFRGNINIYLHFVSFLHIDTTQVVEILPRIRGESNYST